MNTLCRPLSTLYPAGGPSTAALPATPLDPPLELDYTSFSTGRVKRRAALARRRAEAAAKIRADARSDVVASARRSPVAPNVRSCASRSANAFAERSVRRVNILTSSRVVAASRVQMRKASRVSRKRAAQRGCLGGRGALAARSHDRNRPSAAWLTFGNRTTSSGISPFDAPGFAAPPRDGCASIE